MKRKAFLLLLTLVVLIAAAKCWANQNEARELVAPYAHFPWAVGAATGPFTTHYIISSTTASVATVNVKCYNDSAVRVGPAGGINVSLTAFDTDPVWLTGLTGVTTDPNFTGFGWCYFAVTAGDDVAVTFISGISVGNNLITTNSSLALIADTAQSVVTTNDANIPYWTKEGSWNTYILALNPTTTSRNLTMNVYGTSGNLLGTWTGIGSFAARDLEFASIPDVVGATGFGNADITVNGRGFVGWVAAVNFISHQAFIYPVALDKDDISALSFAERP